MSATTIAKNEAIDGVTVNRLSLHSGDPGASGTANEVSGGGYSRQAATFAAASGGERALNADVEFDGPSEQSVTHVGFWESDSPDVFKFGKALESGSDGAFNAAGEYVIAAAGTKLVADDLA